MQVNGFFKKSRIILVSVFLISLFFVTLGKFIYLAVQGKPVKTKAPSSVERGSILDRNGKPLAVDTHFYHFGVSPSRIKNIPEFVQIVSQVLKLDEEETSSRIENAADNREKFLYIKKKISQEQYEETFKLVSEKGWDSFCRFDQIPGRVYPENSLASALIGFMGTDGKGLSGIEYSQQDILSPPLTPESEGVIHGDNIYLTIDANLQYKLEKIAGRVMEETQAESIMILAASAKNGEILSYISLPSANLNEFGKASAEEKIDRPAVTAYEPGSVFKIFTASALLDSQAITPDDAFLCDSVYKKVTNLGETIKLTCLDRHGWVNQRKALEFSCNEFFYQAAERLTAGTFLEYLQNFGFGEKTGIELPLETRGFVKNTSDQYWSARSLPTMAIGQELSVSALQMIEAATAIANKGTKIKLTVIDKICDLNGNIKYNHEVQYAEKVLSPSTADFMLDCMKTTVDFGTGHKAALGDISIGVKTGTAQMADTVKGGYSQSDFVSNCLAIFPVENPRIILYVVITKAKGETYAGRIVTPVIHEAANEIIDHLGLTRNNAASLEHSGYFAKPETDALEIKNVLPDFTGCAKSELLNLINNPNLNIIIKGEGWVTKQSPEPGTPITDNMQIELTLEY